MEKYIHKIDDIIKFLEIKNDKEKALTLLENLKDEIMYDIASKSMTKSDKSVAKTLRAILKSVDDNHPQLKKLYYNKNHVVQFCTGFIGGTLNNVPSGFEISEDCMVDIENVISGLGLCNYKSVTFDKFELQLLAEQNKHRKEDEVMPYIFTCGEEKIGVNPSYVLDMLIIYGDDCEIKAGTPISPLYVKGKNGEGIIMPVRLPKEEY